MLPSLDFVSAGHFTSRGEWRHPTVAVPTWELIYVTEGEFSLFIGERELHAAVGNAILLPPRLLHGGTAPTSRRVSFIWLHVGEGEGAEQLISHLPSRLSNLQTSFIPQLLRQILHNAGRADYPRELISAACSLLFAELGAAVREREAAVTRGVIYKMQEWIRINSDRRIEVRELAREFSYNEDYVARIFKRALGVSPKEYIDARRMAALRTRLLTTDKSLKEIADEAGFKDYKDFLKFFTYHEKISPTEFRETCYIAHTNNK